MIKEYLNDFIGMNSNNIYSINDIDIWLLKYSNTFQKEYTKFYQLYWFEFEDGTVGRLPPCLKTTDKEIFFALYKALKSISDFHKNEIYFEHQMILYHEIKNAPLQIKEWLSKNEELGRDNYITFLLDYLDYDDEENIENLKIYVPELENLDIYIAHKEFKNTLKFLETFNELYWV